MKSTKKIKKSLLAMTALLCLQSTSAFAANDIDHTDKKNINTSMGNKLTIMCDGIISFYSSRDGIDFYAPPLITNGGKNDAGAKYGPKADKYWDNYFRVNLRYDIDSKLSFISRLHSGYDAVGDGAKNTNQGFGVDQSYFRYRDKKNNMTYKVGKQGAYMGQGMVFDSTGNWTGVNIGYGDWTQPTSVQLYFWENNSGTPMKAIDINHEIVKNVSLSATYIDMRTSYPGTTYQSFDQKKGITVSGTTYYPINTYTTEGTTKSNTYISFGARAKLKKNMTLLGETAHNTCASGASASGYYAEVYTGPTNDMTSGLPYEKVGTEVISLRYQDIGTNSVNSPVPGMYRNFKGWRVNYGKVLTNGVSADIAYSNMQRKDDPSNQTCNLVVAEVAFKL